jgi:hypothetical protein
LGTQLGVKISLIDELIIIIILEINLFWEHQNQGDRFVGTPIWGQY